MSNLVNLAIDGKAVQAAPGTLIINAAKQAGIEIPSFCYYEGLHSVAACRMCLVEVEKTPKLQVACTTPVAEGMVVHTESPTAVGARKGMIEFLLTSRQNLTAVLNRLERLGLIERVRMAIDGHIRGIRLTQHGAKIWNRMLINIRAYYKRALDGFSNEECLSFAAFLTA